MGVIYYIQKEKGVTQMDLNSILYGVLIGVLVTNIYRDYKERNKK